MLIVSFAHVANGPKIQLKIIKHKSNHLHWRLHGLFFLAIFSNTSELHFHKKRSFSITIVWFPLSRECQEMCVCACVRVWVRVCECVCGCVRMSEWKNGLGSQFSDCSLHCSAKAMWVNDNRVGFNSPAAEEEGKSESEIVHVLDRSHMRKTLPLTWKQNWPISFNFLFEYSIQERVHRRGGSSKESSSPSFFNQPGVKPEPHSCPTYRPSLTWIDQIWVLVSHFC